MVEVPQLKYWRQQRALTMRELADKAGVSHMTVFRIEHGKPAGLRTLRKLAEALGVQPRDLMAPGPDQGQQEAA